MEEKKYTFEDLLNIVKLLRSENGCNWDKVQTHESLKECIIEEAYEVVDAIETYSDTKVSENLLEELGDVLLQVVMHSEIGSEENEFCILDVINEECKKMIRRHPHVFGDAKADTTEEVLYNWEEIKKEEKKDKIVKADNPLSEVPKAFPALLRAYKVKKKAKKISAIQKNIKEIKENIVYTGNSINEKFQLEEENKDIINHLLMSVVDLAVELKVNPETVLAEGIENYIKEEISSQEGLE